MSVAMGPCPDEQQLLELVEGLVPPSDLPRFELHLQGCASCFSRVAAGRSVTSALSGAPAGDTMPAMGQALAARYRIEAHLGAGGCGQVFSATDTVTETTVAVKILRAELAEDPQWVTRLARELRLAREIQSPHVCRVFTLERGSQAPFLVMELASRSLRAELQNDALAEPLAAARAVCGGLAALHQGGIIHRDLKPENILRMADGRLVISDLGLATAATGPAQTRYVGTPYYMAPEVLRGEMADKRSDVWSLGMVLREILHHLRPDRRSARPATAVSRWRRAARRKALQRLCRRCLSSTPAARPPDAGRVLREFDAIVAGSLGASIAARPRVVPFAVLTVLMVVVAAAAARTRHPPAPGRSAGPTFVTGIPDSSGPCPCPFSSCVSDHCVSSCRASGFTVGRPVPGINVRGRQEALLGASTDGNAILYLTGRRCALDRLLLARRRGDSYLPADLTDDPDLGGTSIDETCCTLSGDGRSLILRSADQRHFLDAPVEGNDVLPFTADPFARLTEGLPAAVTVSYPVLTPDGRTLYFMAALNGQFHGLLSSTRAGPGLPFPPASKLAGEAQRYERVSGVSADGLTLFMTFNFETIVLSRPGGNAPFAPPRSQAAPPRLLGWRAIPIEGCRRILTTVTPGGCESEDITFLEAEDGVRQ